MKKPITVRVKTELTFDEIDVRNIAREMVEAFWDTIHSNFENIEREDIDDEDFAGLVRAIADEFQDIVEEEE